jgi:hypothetical protein
MPNWSPWQSCKPCPGSPPTPVGCVTPTPTCVTCLFPYLPQQPGYNKRLRAATDLLQRVVNVLARNTTLWTDDVWVGDSTPVECGRSTQTVHRSELAGRAQYGDCASHSRDF